MNSSASFIPTTFFNKKDRVRNNKQLFLPIFLIVVFIDQSTKFLASIFEINIIYNTGISFSKLSQSDPKFLTFMLLILIYFLFNYFKKYWKENSFAAGLFFGGAVANLFDRILFDAVRDWIYIPFTDIQNNLADWAIFIGLVMLLYPVVIKKNNKKIDN